MDLRHFTAPLAHRVWDMRYRWRDDGGGDREQSIEDTWGRVARALAAVEPADAPGWERRFGDSLADAGGILPVSAEMFRDFLDQQGVFVYFMTVYVGAGLIANDRRANALQIYLSKPMLRMEYIGGKLLILVTFLLNVTLVPALLLLLLQVAFAGNTTYLMANLFVVPAIVLSSLITVTVASFTMLALSSLSNSSRFVAIMYTGAIFFTSAMFGALRVIFGSTRVAWVSITANLEQVGDIAPASCARAASRAGASTTPRCSASRTYSTATRPPPARS